MVLHKAVALAAARVAAHDDANPCRFDERGSQPVRIVGLNVGIRHHPLLDERVQIETDEADFPGVTLQRLYRDLGLVEEPRKARRPGPSLGMNP